LSGKNNADDRRYAWRADKMGSQLTFQGSAKNHDSEAFRSIRVNAVIDQGVTLTINNSHTKEPFIPVFFLKDDDSSKVLKRIGFAWRDFSNNTELTCSWQ